MQLLLFWLAASPDGMVYDRNFDNAPGLIEIKCPYTKRNAKLHELFEDKNFYLEKDELGNPVLKRGHHFGYFTQIQMAMGLSQVKYCDFIVFTFKCIVIIRTNFDEEYFEKLITTLNTFYKTYYLPKILETQHE